ncbi:MAG: hypothetical protein VX512_12435 [Pseudomonadota bacterium]|nr:hypothetical protein [Pseudomonadota bacterium]
MTERRHYGHGTAAGHKGRSNVTRQNSVDAAAKVTENLGQRHRLMLSAWTPYGAAGATPEQIADDTGLPVHVVRPRAGELVKRGLFFEVGKRPGNLGCRVTAYSVVKPSETV